MKYKIHIIPDELSRSLNGRGRDYTRELARQRDNRTCQNCAKKWLIGQRRFDIHHIVGCGTRSMEYDKTSELDNLITYCHKCHLNLHTVRLKMANKTGQQKLARKKSIYYSKQGY